MGVGLKQTTCMKLSCWLASKAKTGEGGDLGFDLGTRAKNWAVHLGNSSPTPWSSLCNCSLTCLFSNDSEKGGGFGREGRKGEIWKHRGYRNHNQDTLYDKNLFSVKEKIINNDFAAINLTLLLAFLSCFGLFVYI